LTVFAAIFALMAAGTAATFFFGGCFITREERMSAKVVSM
jgi:hypothetical protein